MVLIPSILADKWEDNDFSKPLNNDISSHDDIMHSVLLIVFIILFLCVLTITLIITCINLYQYLHGDYYYPTINITYPVRNGNNNGPFDNPINTQQYPLASPPNYEHQNPTTNLYTPSPIKQSNSILKYNQGGDGSS